MILSGIKIRELGIMRPHCSRTTHNGMTYGEGPAGYDVRAEFDHEGRAASITIPPGAFALASTVEEFVMPADVLGVVHDKSTWARMGVAVQNTVIEPGWRGHLTLELTNHASEPIVIIVGDPIAQIIFHQVSGAVNTYDGKYQDQERGPQEAR